MRFDRSITRLFAMDDRVWARHASPWSVWTRIATLPLLIMVFWSRVWLGEWALLPIALALIWTWLNPRLFAPPDTTDHWTSRAVLGERVWLNRSRIPIPAHHARAALILSAVAAIGGLITVWGVIVLDVYLTVLGAVLVYGGKLWFLDRMVWLYQDMQTACDEYRRWLY